MRSVCAQPTDRSHPARRIRQTNRFRNTRGCSWRRQPGLRPLCHNPADLTQGTPPRPARITPARAARGSTPCLFGGRFMAIVATWIAGGGDLYRAPVTDRGTVQRVSERGTVGVARHHTDTGFDAPALDSPASGPRHLPKTGHARRAHADPPHGRRARVGGERCSQRTTGPAKAARESATRRLRDGSCPDGLPGRGRGPRQRAHRRAASPAFTASASSSSAWRLLRIRLAACFGFDWRPAPDPPGGLLR